MWKKLKAIDYRHYIALLMILGSVAIGLMVYEYPFIRFFEACRDLGRSAMGAFWKIYEKEVPEGWFTVNEFSYLDLKEILGINLEEFQYKFTNVWQFVGRKEYFLYYLIFLLYYFVQFLIRFCFVLIVLIPLILYNVLTWNVVSTDHNADTLPLRIYRRCVEFPCRQALAWCKDFWQFFEPKYKKWFIGVWLFNLGLFTVIVSFLAYYFYILATFSFSTIHIQLGKLLADGLLAFHSLPIVVWCVLGFCIWARFNRKLASIRLHHQVAQTEETQKQLPMVTFLVGLPRSGKTTMLTGLALMFSRIFRNKAQELMEGNAFKFPHFPWINLEQELRRAVEDHTVWNLATVREWVRQKRVSFEEDSSFERIFGYNFMLEPFTYNDHLVVIDIWTSIENYAQEFFIYWLQTSLLIGNYAVREDFIFHDVGNYPLLDDDFLNRDARDIPYISTMSHILDNDMLRLGLKMVQDNVHSGALEFGVVLYSEIDKERKNTQQLQEVKGKTDVCNQKNDLLEEDISIAGHAATVENFCFFRMIADAQRPSAWGAKGRELSTVLYISPKSGGRNALPFFWVAQTFIDGYLDWWRELRRERRYVWGNNHLLPWLLHDIGSALYTYQLHRVNDYGFYRQKMEMESGSLDGNRIEMHIDMPHKLIYSHRFATDCFKSISETKAKKCPVGLNDIPVYEGLHPSFEEFAAQNSHFYREMFRYYEIDVESVGEE